MDKNKYKVIYSPNYGIFQFSDLAKEIMKEKGISLKDLSFREVRTNPEIVKIVEELGSKLASGEFSRLEIDEVPNQYDFGISDYDGAEKVVLKARKPFVRFLAEEGKIDELIRYLEKTGTFYN